MDVASDGGRAAPTPLKNTSLMITFTFKGSLQPNHTTSTLPCTHTLIYLCRHLGSMWWACLKPDPLTGFLDLMRKGGQTNAVKWMKMMFQEQNVKNITSVLKYVVKKLHFREKGGRGSHVDVSLTLISQDFSWHFHWGSPTPPWEPRTLSPCPGNAGTNHGLYMRTTM